MRNRTALPLLGTVLALILVLVSRPTLLHFIGAVPLILFLPGYALSLSMFGPDMPAGQTSLLSLALSIAITGIGSLVLVLAHVFARVEIISVDGAIGIGAGSIAAWRLRKMPPRRRAQTNVRTKVLIGVSGIVSIAILVFAFALDSTSAKTAQEQSSVALSAVSAGMQLKIGVIAPGNASFSGTLQLKRSSTVLRAWIIRRIPAGGRWAPAGSVQLPGGSGVVQLVLSHHGSPIRVVRVSPTHTPAAHA